MLFEDDERLTTTELRERLSVSHGSWHNHNKEILDYLNKTCCTILLEGKSNRPVYHIVHQFAEYESWKTRSSREKNKQIYKPLIEESVELYPEATYVAINEDVYQNKAISKIHKKGTSYNYVLECTKELYGAESHTMGEIGNNNGKVWCKKKADQIHYEPLSQVELSNWKKILSKTFKTQDEKIGDIIADFQEGIISKE